MQVIIHQWSALPNGVLFSIKRVYADGFVYLHSVGQDNPRLKIYVWAKNKCLEEGDFVVNNSAVL